METECSGIKRKPVVNYDPVILKPSGDADHPPKRAATPKKKSNDGAQEPQLIDVELEVKSDHAITENISRFRRNLQSIGHKLPDKGANAAKVKENLRRQELEIERKKKLESEKANKGGKESTQLSDHIDDGAASHGKKKSGSKSPYGVTMSALTHDLLTDEKMQKIVNELVNLGISQYDVGKAAEVCYKDLVKVKVLFALPSDMRRSYVLGFLHPQN